MPSAPQGTTNLPPTTSLPTSTVELSVRCTDLADKDLLSKSDPLCVMYMQRNGQWFEVGRTEVIKDNLSPAWEKKFVVDYSFEERQVVKFEIYDHDAESNNLDYHDFLGRCESTMGSIVSSGAFVALLRDSSKSGSKIHIMTEELKSSKESVQFKFRAEKLDKKDFFGKSDPFYVISRSVQGSQWTVVKRSETIMKTLNPNWAPFEISARELCNSDHERPLKIDIYDWNSDGTHDFIGSINTSLSKLETTAIEQTGIPVINEDKKRRKSSYKNSGTLFVEKCKIETVPSFIEYLQGGVTMNFSVAVDFTASNGDPRTPRSLHYMGGGPVDNQYTTAIKSVGEIIQDYDSDKQFPALGFGAQVPPTGQVSHEFFLNLRTDTPFCAGVDGLLAAYWHAIQNVRLYGPTNFAPVINHVANFARAYQVGKVTFNFHFLRDFYYEIPKFLCITYNMMPCSALPTFHNVKNSMVLGHVANVFENYSRNVHFTALSCPFGCP